MAKDGSNRGGARMGAGRKKKPLADKILDGNPGKHPLTIVEFEAPELESADTPKPSAFLSQTQKDGTKLIADEIYYKTNEWLKERRCAQFVAPDLIERYAVSSARWIQCEEAVSQYGFLAKHPTTGNAMQSPYVSMSVNYMSQTSRIWTEIYQIVKDNCTSEFRGVTPQDDVMERLLTIRK